MRGVAQRDRLGRHRLRHAAHRSTRSSSTSSTTATGRSSRRRRSTSNTGTANLAPVPGQTVTPRPARSPPATAPNHPFPPDRSQKLPRRPHPREDRKTGLTEFEAWGDGDLPVKPARPPPATSPSTAGRRFPRPPRPSLPPSTRSRRPTTAKSTSTPTPKPLDHLPIQDKSTGWRSTSAKKKPSPGHLHSSTTTAASRPPPPTPSSTTNGATPSHRQPQEPPPKPPPAAAPTTSPYAGHDRKSASSSPTKAKPAAA